MTEIDPQAVEQFDRLLEDLKTEYPELGIGFLLHGTRAGKIILGWRKEQQRLFVLYLVRRLIDDSKKIKEHLSELRAQPNRVPQDQSRRELYRARDIKLSTLVELLTKHLPLAGHDLTELIDLAIDDHGFFAFYGWQLSVRIVESLKTESLTDEFAASISKFIERLEASSLSADTRKNVAMIQQLAFPTVGSIRLVPGEAWSDRAIADIGSLPADARANWQQLFAHLTRASGSSPSTKWLKTANSLLDKIGPDQFQSFILKWFGLVDGPRSIRLERRYEWQPDPNSLLDDFNADLLRGLAWLCARHEDAEIARALTALALSAYRKVPGVGPRCVRVGNACVWALGHMPGMAGVYQLAILQARVKFGTAQAGIAKALAVAAEREGLPRDEIDELSVPTYGLTDVGLRRETLAEFVAELHVVGSGDTELRWFNAVGKQQKSVPKAVKSDFADELKELQQAAKDIQRMLPAQRDRIDNLYIPRKTWRFDTWRERYLDHPLVGTLARRLIWRIATEPGESSTLDVIWHDGQLVNADDRPVDDLAANATVSLWHPLDAATEQALAWRSWLERHEVQQPFKQAHREIYLLTEAEQRTGVYSNRFAAHVLKQHQFNALCAVRGWRNRLRLLVDDEYPPATKELPAFGLRAEFWIEGAGDNYGVDTNETGTFLYVTTDQVRFYRIDAAENTAHAYGGGYRWRRRGENQRSEPLPLDQIPPLVFSEILRDVDLFVGVASVGNDTTWGDGGATNRYVDYWNGYSFGDLSETAKTRKQVLERLVPRLKIAGRCEIRDRFLVVRGDLRTYKIHLGSGNILMEPNDEYLCIVPRQSVETSAAGNSLFLPFEGDRTLAIILSKAFLLADDKAIADTSITRQIRRAA